VRPAALSTPGAALGFLLPHCGQGTNPCTIGGIPIRSFASSLSAKAAICAAVYNGSVLKNYFAKNAKIFQIGF